jgi:hypothetical protein
VSHRRTGIRRAGIAQVGAPLVGPTGVVAGTYGDATNVGQFTVGADGRLTSAANVAIAGALPVIGAGQVLANPTGASATPIGTTGAQVRRITGERIAAFRLRQGLLAETVPHQFCGVSGSGANALVSGVVYFQPVFLFAGEVASKGFVTATETIANTTTLAKLGLYDNFGVRQPVSASAGGAWNTLGSYVAAFTAPYTIPSDNTYWLAVLCTFTGTSPALLMSMPVKPVAQFGILFGPPGVGAQDWYYTHNAIVTDLPANATFGFSFQQAMPWVGLA